MKQKKLNNPLDQKTKLLDQLKNIQNKITQFDTVQSQKIAHLAKRYQLIDLSDDILEIEFQLIQEKYQKEIPSQNHDTKKNSSGN